MKKLSILLASVVMASLFANCTTDDSEDNSALLLAALAATAPNCTVGSTAFYATGEVSCADNKAVASGVAFLNAASQHGDFASVGVTIDANVTSVQFFAHRANRKTDDDASGDAGIIIKAGSVEMYGTEKTPAAPATNATAANTAGGTGNYCLEVHSDGGAGHALADDIECTPTASGGVAQTEDTGLGTGKSWGFVLNQASISNVKTNSEEQFTD